ncbi:hypothetical protein SUDANB95_07922 (plasmid) [Actinosynnema sp. ALI-1.44]
MTITVNDTAHRPDGPPAHGVCGVRIWLRHGAADPEVLERDAGDDAAAVLERTRARLVELLPAHVVRREWREPEIPLVWAVVETPLGEIHLDAAFPDDDPERPVAVTATAAVACCGPLGGGTWG